MFRNHKSSQETWRIYYAHVQLIILNRALFMLALLLANEVISENWVWQMQSKFYELRGPKQNDQICPKVTGVNESKKIITTILFSMIDLISVPNFIEIWQILFLGPNWPKSDKCQWTKKNHHHHFIQHDWFDKYTKFH